MVYINSKTLENLIQDLKRNNVKVMADVSEALRNSGNPLDNTGDQIKGELTRFSHHRFSV